MNKSILILFASIIAGCSVTQKSSKTAPEFPKFSSEAHRGGRGVMPENTIPAMLYSVDLGLTTLEMDSRITSDGKVILFHDDYLNPAWVLGPEGAEMPKGQKLSPFKMTYEDIQKYDVGSKFNEAYPQQKKMKVEVPLLERLIDSVQGYLKKTGKRQVFYNIETKSSEKGDGTINPTPEVFVKTLMDVIEAKKIAQFVVIQSFDKRTLQVIHKKYPYIKTSYLIGNDKKTVEGNLEELGFTPFIYSPAYKLVDAQLVKVCHDKGIKVIPWTVNTAQEINDLKKLGVDGIISDYPKLLVD